MKQLKNVHHFSNYRNTNKKPWKFYPSQNDKDYQNNEYKAERNMGKKGHLATRQD